jgi:hypothetical protein
MDQNIPKKMGGKILGRAAAAKLNANCLFNVKQNK